MTRSYYLVGCFLLISISCSFGQSNRQRYIDSANVYLSELKNYTALSFFEKALKESLQVQDSVHQVEDLLSIASTQEKIGEMEQSLATNLIALRLIDKMNDNDTLRFNALIQISFYFVELEDLKTAKVYLDRAYQIAKVKDEAKLFRAYYNACGIYERRKENYPKSIDYYKKALELTPENAPDEKFKFLVSLSTAYAYNNDYKVSRECLARAEKVNERINSDLNQAILCGQIGRLELLMGNHNVAIEYYRKGLKLSEERKHLDFIQRFNRELARIYSKKGDYKTAYAYYTDFVKVFTEQSDKKNADVIAEMSAKYELEKNEQKIAYLETQRILETQLYRSKLNRRNQIIGFTSLFGLLAVISAIWIIRSQLNKQRIRLELLEKNREVQEQKSIMEGQEVERNRLSRELHDGLGGALASIKLRLSNSVFEHQDRILQELDDACEEVRNVSHSLSTIHIQNSNFSELLQRLAYNFEQSSNIKVQFDFFPVEELNQLSDEVKHQCYRIFQELTANIKKHAEATQATIGLILDDSDVILLVEDNGKGFDAQQKATGIGLINVKERVNRISGQLEFHTKLGSGTSISIRFPFQNQ